MQKGRRSRGPQPGEHQEKPLREIVPWSGGSPGRSSSVFSSIEDGVPLRAEEKQSVSPAAGGGS